ncbi:MAG: NAD-dependent epimerase/dehydratase family protein [Gemmataceae bacterium]
MKCVVTGAAGFIGSHLCEALLKAGHEVVGLDAFIPYYPKPLKERNLAAVLGHTRFNFHALDLRQDSLDAALAGSEVIFHLAAMPGLVKSWTDFDLYNSCNVQATQRLLEAVRQAAPPLRRFLYASTSSVYGKFSTGDETLPTRPTSPYGITKLAAEHLCRAYAENYELPLVVLRYFSVYGPRQRPDMGYFRFIQALQRNESITVFGDGQQVRGNTYVTDCVAATLAAVEAPVGESYNLGGGESASVWDILHKLEAIAGKKAHTKQERARPGDQRQTLADTTKLRNHFGWQAHIGLDEGLRRQWDWQKENALGSNKG